MVDMFKKIKKQNGERFAKSIRSYDNGIFDIENLDQIVKYAGRDAEPIMDYLISLKGVEIAEHMVSKTPIQLLEEAGYDAYYADTLEKQNAISHYYADAQTLRELAEKNIIDNNYAYTGEKLCTFGDEERYERYYIINAVRKDVDDIRREDFPHPEREDKYGTSVLSIQVLKTGGFISIKNRYNHTVQNPDNTLNSNPDNIIPGLSMSIKQYFNVDFSAQQVPLPNKYTFINNQIIKYEHEENNVYIGDSFYLKDGVVTEISKDYQEMIEHRIILDKKNGTINELTETEDTLAQVLQNEITGKKISVTKDKESKETRILVDGQELCVMQGGKLISLTLLETTELPKGFLSKICLSNLREFNAPKLKRIGDNSLLSGNFNITCPELEEIGNNVLSRFDCNGRAFMPKLRTVGNDSLCIMANMLDSFDNLEVVGNNSLKYSNVSSYPKLKKVGNDCFCMGLKDATTLYVPELEEVGNDCFCNVNQISNLDFPKLRIAGDNFIRALGKEDLKRRINLPNLEQVGDNCMCNGSGWYQYRYDFTLEELNAPKLKKVGDNFMENCTDVQRINMPSEVVVPFHSTNANFMPKIPAEKRPNIVKDEPIFLLEMPEETDVSENNIISRVPSLMGESTLVAPNTVSQENVSEKIDAPDIPTDQSMKTPSGLKNRLYEVSEKGRMAKLFKAIQSVVFRKHKDK